MNLTLINAPWHKSILLGTAANYYASKLGLRNKNIHVKVKLVSKLKARFKCWGRAYQDSPREYIIQIDRASKTSALARILAHELVHVNQWVTGRMKDLQDNHVRWGTRTYNTKRLGYDKHPWEREAYRVGPRLYKSFTQHYGPK